MFRGSLFLSLSLSPSLSLSLSPPPPPPFLRLLPRLTKANRNVQFTDKRGKLVETGNPVSYSTLTDLPKLPLAAIDAIDALTFTTIDNKLHSYRKSGISWSGVDRNQLTIVFTAAGRSMDIDATKKEATFHIRGNDNKVTSFGVVLPKEETKTSARRALAASGALEGRCIENGACLHTLAEIMMIHGKEGRSLAAASVSLWVGEGGSRAEQAQNRSIVTHSKGRPLANHHHPTHTHKLITPQGVSYAEVLQDGVAAMSGQAAIDEATSFFSEMQVANGANGTAIASSQSYYVGFTFHDRCSNYNLERCNQAATESDITDNVTAAIVGPYFGTDSVNGIWHFTDEITYEKDSETMKVTIRYAHDRLKESRAHVIMMKNDGSAFLQYDEYTLVEGEAPVMALCTASS